MKNERTNERTNTSEVVRVECHGSKNELNIVVVVAAFTAAAAVKIEVGPCDVVTAEGAQDDAGVGKGFPPDEVGAEAEVFLGDVEIPGAGDEEAVEATIFESGNEVGALEDAAHGI